ncbi:hypothetical protein AHiyo8_pI66470 (plasmid) [Arthrobacter sp. Hiyo8]|nr:hypothetical protein AHiyo8_pI66470 [Arthrobacter sp. Hiyo8]
MLCCSPDLMADFDEREVGKGKVGSVNSSVGRIALITIGVIAVIIGGVFAGQGMNLIPGSFKSVVSMSSMMFFESRGRP